MEKNSQKKGSLPKGGEPNGGVKKALQKDSPHIACPAVVSDSKQLEYPKQEPLPGNAEQEEYEDFYQNQSG